MPTFPALDEEPPRLSRRSRLRRGAVALAAVVVLAGAGIGGWAIYRSVSGASSTASGSKVLLMNSSDFLALAKPDGTGAKQLTQFGPIHGSFGFLAPDGRTLLTDTGDTVTLRDGQPVRHSTALYSTLGATTTVVNTGGGVYTSSGGIFTLAPFADHGADVVFSTPQLTANGDPSSRQSVGIAPTAGGKGRSLGLADDYVGDPQQPAAFISVPATTAHETGDISDTAVVHRTAGAAATTVVTATQVRTDLGLPGAPALSLRLFPDPTGKTLAVQVDDPRSTQTVGLLVYTRTGRLIARADTAPSGPLYWNTKGTELLFSTAHGMALWTPAGATEHITTPSDAAILQSCVFSGDDSRAACIGYPSRGQHYDAWVVLDLAKRTATSFPPTGVPLLWVK